MPTEIITRTATGGEDPKRRRDLERLLAGCKCDLREVVKDILSSEEEHAEDSPHFLTVRQIAKDLQIAEKTVIRYIKDGELEGIDVGRGSRPEYRVHKDMFDRWLLVKRVNKEEDTEQKE